MKVLNPRTVELTPGEIRAKNYFDGELDRGLSIPDALRKTRRYFSNESSEFYTWLGR